MLTKEKEKGVGHKKVKMKRKRGKRQHSLSSSSFPQKKFQQEKETLRALLAVDFFEEKVRIGLVVFSYSHSAACNMDTKPIQIESIYATRKKGKVMTPFCSSSFGRHKKAVWRADDTYLWL